MDDMLSLTSTRTSRQIMRDPLIGQPHSLLSAIATGSPVGSRSITHVAETKSKKRKHHLRSERDCRTDRTSSTLRWAVHLSSVAARGKSKDTQEPFHCNRKEDTKGRGQGA